ncbi:alpha/beta hydrolase [Isoptericola sp. NPDC019482]|uniref:alpha/beta fold hydrolase n=1 Tax=Isoptericola sp. NPDC019482 TaxID=3154688 RepID=UPI003493E5EF
MDLSVADTGGDGPPVLLLHGLAGSSRELMATARGLADASRVLLLDQRGHGASTRRPADLSRQAFVDDVIAVVECLAPGRSVALVGQSMGAHTAFLVAEARPDLVDRLVMLEGHAGAGEGPEAAAALGAYFASWPVPFADEQRARAFLGESPLTSAWIADLERTPDGLRPRFDADVMRRTLEAVHEPRWAEWERLSVPTLAVFAEHGMFTSEQQDELLARRPSTRRADLADASHDAHLDGFDAWVATLREFLGAGTR